ncbi:MAG: SoxR reducing system RseC family protein [Natronospirillum sp.]|uniref:SoxR reducing system RseC family protein n=1 Tax=Natronospirillum sp. TaxID=2812955 RepID=UPI0025D77707|nr:SoxR reducing system RseC family protein [Natronospirillum sp.]MCH8550482.1 SoxR reducing system RseC family protein [Natronospirillum sp.]
MLEEEATVFSVDTEWVWVETLRNSACGRCAARAGCGQPLMARVLGAGRSAAHSRLPVAWPESGLRPSVGTRVVIGIPESSFLRLAFMLYLLPVLALLFGALGAHLLSGQDMVAMLAAVAAFALSLLWVRRWQHGWQRDPRWQPRLLRLVPDPGPGNNHPAEAVKVL